MPKEIVYELSDKTIDKLKDIAGAVDPTGEIEITENGTYDVTNFASANVNVGGAKAYTVKEIISTLDSRKLNADRFLAFRDKYHMIIDNYNGFTFCIYGVSSNSLETSENFMNLLLQYPQSDWGGDLYISGRDGNKSVRVERADLEDDALYKDKLNQLPAFYTSYYETDQYIDINAPANSEAIKYSYIIAQFSTEDVSWGQFIIPVEEFIDLFDLPQK